jgi:hypothetical protein
MHTARARADDLLKRSGNAPCTLPAAKPMCNQADMRARLIGFWDGIDCFQPDDEDAQHSFLKEMEQNALFVMRAARSGPSGPATSRSPAVLAHRRGLGRRSATS